MQQYGDSVPIFKALADETRLQILDMLSSGEYCACKLLEHFNFKQPTLSYHMKILTESGLVRGVRDGSWMRYTLVADRFAEIQAFITALSADKDARLFDTPQCRRSS